MSPLEPGFESRLRVEKINSHWRLIEQLAYDSAVLSARVVVPAGFETDFASVPRLPFAFWLAGDTAHLAAVVHDFLYTIQLCSRVEADRVFYEAMTLTGVPLWRRSLMYAAVRVGGWAIWRRRRK